MKKKALAVFLATMTAVTMMSACGSKKVEETKEAVTETAENAKEAAGDAADDAKEAVDDAKEAAADAAEGAKEAAEDAAEGTKEAAADAADDAKEAVDDAKEAAADAAEGAKEAAEGAADAVGDAAENAEEAAGDAAEGAKEAAEDAAEGAKEAAADAAEGAKEAAEDAAEGTKEAAADAAEGAKEAAEDAADAVGDAVDNAKEAASDVADAAGEAAENAKEAAENAADDAKEAAENAADAAGEAAEGAKEAAETVVSGLESALYPATWSYTGASYNEAAPDWTEYLDLIAQIKSETDTEKRVALMHQAEDILMGTGAVIPLYYYKDLYLQKPDVEGIYSNLYGYKYFQSATSPRDVLNVYLASEPASIDPALNASIDGTCMIVNLFSGLYTYDETGALQPDLADPENPCEISDDGLTYTFHLQDGLKWSDGSDLTAYDFVYSWNRAAADETGADYAYMFEAVAGYGTDKLEVEAADERTLTVKLAAPCAYFLDLCAFPAYLPVPQAQVEAAEDWETNPGSWCAEAGFVTNGAYTVDSWTHDDSIVFRKNANYHKADDVSIEEIDFVLSADNSAVYAAYQAGELDFSSVVPGNEIASIKDTEDFRVADELGTSYVAFNVNSPLFEEKTVDQANAMRKAVGLLIDRQYIIDNIGQCDQTAATSFIPEGMSDGNGGVFKENSDSYTYPNKETAGYYPVKWSNDVVDEARALLEYAGYEFNEDGKLSKETPIQITYLTVKSPAQLAIAEALKQDLAHIGIDMTVETCAWKTFLEERSSGQFDLIRGGWLADFNDPINMLEMWSPQSGNNVCQLGVEAADADIIEAAADAAEGVKEAVSDAADTAAEGAKNVKEAVTNKKA